MLEVRDPIHGAIRLSSAEIEVVDRPFVQRLRNVRSTGFSYLPFPGATHSRYAHSLGVMHLAGLAFDSAFEGRGFADRGARERYRSVVRIAALCHDLGHSPFSHCTEWAMPSLASLAVQFYGAAARVERRATHEDYTIAMLEHEHMAGTIDANFPFTARHVAALISRDVDVHDSFFCDGGLDYRLVLSQIVSSELDVDRLDYLVRDSYYSGARYGQIDVQWLITNLDVHTVDDTVGLALDDRAIYAFDDFMIARHHMFLMVYFHHKSVVYEEMLKRWVMSPQTGWQLPSRMEAYAKWDDISLIQHLRAESNPWAQRVVQQRPFKRVFERHGSPDEVDLSDATTALDEAGIQYLAAGSTGKLSRYNIYGQKREKAPVIHVFERLPGSPVQRVKTLAEATAIFKRYADARRLARIYTSEADAERARELLWL